MHIYTGLCNNFEPGSIVGLNFKLRPINVMFCSNRWYNKRDRCGFQTPPTRRPRPSKTSTGRNCRSWCLPTGGGSQGGWRVGRLSVILDKLLEGIIFTLNTYFIGLRLSIFNQSIFQASIWLCFHQNYACCVEIGIWF